MSYIDTLSLQTKEYYKVLSKEFPLFLNDYIETTEMQKLDGINQICGGYWRKIYSSSQEEIYSVLKHSIGVALIIWNFTKDKKQTIAGLLHDISSPAFKHCIDFLNGDAKKQESTEEETKDVIYNSKEIMQLLERDNIKLEEVCDYKIYPIADNETPKLSADRLEYTFMNGVHYKKVWNIDEIKEIYDNIFITKNENGKIELAFKDVEIADKFINGASQLWPLWINAEDTITMYFFADTIKKMYEKKFIFKEDLYKYPEKKIIQLIESCEDTNISKPFKQFMNCTKFIECDEYKKDKFCVDMNVKRRYINPIVNNKRIYDISEKSKSKIDNYLNTDITRYAYCDI